MADRQIGCNPMISNFARLLSNISLRLTPEDLSNIKLVLEVDEVLKQKTLDSLPNTADLFRLLHSRKIINENNLNLLLKILEQINRHDCVKLIEKFIQDRRGFENIVHITVRRVMKMCAEKFFERLLEKDLQRSNCSDDNTMKLDEKPKCSFGDKKPHFKYNKYSI